MYKKLKIGLISVFVLIELVLYTCILTIDGKIGTICSFSSVLLAFLFSLIFINFKQHKGLTQFALLFTVIADIFLVLVEPRNQAVAMTSFTFTQLFYFARLLQESGNKTLNKVNCWVRLALSVAIEVVALIVLKSNFDYVSGISMFYYVNLIINMVFAFIQFKKSSLLAFGLLFFLLCDTFVGFQMAFDVYIFVPHSSFIYKFFTLPFNFVWFFYVPAQTCLAISAAVKTRGK